MDLLLYYSEPWDKKVCLCAFEEGREEVFCLPCAL